jgi:hypothetical protein
LFFHAHSLETEHGDFGDGVVLSHGLDAVIQQHKQQLIEPGSVAEIKPESAQASP